MGYHVLNVKELTLVRLDVLFQLEWRNIRQTSVNVNKRMPYLYIFVITLAIPLTLLVLN